MLLTKTNESIAIQACILIDVVPFHVLRNECYANFFLYFISVVVKCKSYAYVFGLLKNILTYLREASAHSEFRDTERD